MMKPADSPAQIPDEWREPRLVLPHLADELGGWLARMRSIEQDLTVVQGALDKEPNPSERNGLAAVRLQEREQLLEWITKIHAELLELNHQVANRLSAYVLIAQDLQRG